MYENNPEICYSEKQDTQMEICPCIFTVEVFCMI